MVFFSSKNDLCALKNGQFVTKLRKILGGSEPNHENAHLKDLKHLELIDKEGLILKMHVIHEKYHVITLSQS